MRGQREAGKIQRNNYHHGNCRPSLTGETSSVSLIFTHQSTKRIGMSEIVESEVAFKATFHSAIFRACKYAIKDTDDVLPEKVARVARIDKIVAGE